MQFVTFLVLLHRTCVNVQRMEMMCWRCVRMCVWVLCVCESVVCVLCVCVCFRVLRSDGMRCKSVLRGAYKEWRLRVCRPHLQAISICYHVKGEREIIVRVNEKAVRTYWLKGSLFSLFSPSLWIDLCNEALICFLVNLKAINGAIKANSLWCSN